MAHEVTLLIPNWNGAALLRRHLPTVVRAAKRSGAPLIVVDDGSTDDSRDVLRHEFPEAHCVIHPENRGFGFSVWTGFQAASTPLVALLNSDVSVPEDFLDPLLEHFSADDVFAASPRILDETGSLVAPSIMTPSWRRGFLRFDASPEAESTSTAKATFFVSGGSAVFARGKFLDLGGFDQLYAPFYSEDVDVCWRAWKRGWRSLFDPRSEVVHAHQGTISANFRWRRVKALKERNRFLLVWANAELRDLLLRHLTPTTLRLPFRVLALDRPYFAGLFRALVMLGMARRARKARRGGLTLEEIMEHLQS